MIYIHNTLRRYISALLNFFNEMKIQYRNSEGDLVERNIPVMFSIREKSDIISDKTENNLLSGNLNVMPRAYLTWSALNRDDTRMRNRNVKTNILRKDKSIEFQFNSIPYQLMIEYKVLCRGMTEACQVLEEVIPYFNPILNLDVYDADNLSEPTRIPIQLIDASIENEGFEEISNNTVTVNVGMQMNINIYSPIRNIENIRKFRIHIDDKDGIAESVLGWDVNDSKVDPDTGKKIDKYIALNSLSLSIDSKNLAVGKNKVFGKVKHHKLDRIKSFYWSVLQSEITPVSFNSTSFSFEVPKDYKGNVDIVFEVKDEFENSQSIMKRFKI